VWCLCVCVDRQYNEWYGSDSANTTTGAGTGAGDATERERTRHALLQQIDAHKRELWMRRRQLLAATSSAPSALSASSTSTTAPTAASAAPASLDAFNAGYGYTTYPPPPPPPPPPATDDGLSAEPLFSDEQLALELGVGADPTATATGTATAAAPGRLVAATVSPARPRSAAAAPELTAAALAQHLRSPNAKVNYLQKVGAVCVA
jgi:hypothetical protein